MQPQYLSRNTLLVLFVDDEADMVTLEQFLLQQGVTTPAIEALRSGGLLSVRALKKTRSISALTTYRLGLPDAELLYRMFTYGVDRERGGRIYNHVLNLLWHSGDDVNVWIEKLKTLPPYEPGLDPWAKGFEPEWWEST